MNTDVYTEGETICCVTCNKALQADLWSNGFFQYLAILLVIVVLLALVVLSIGYVYRLRPGRYRAMLNPAPLVTAALVLGIGMGGFVDGIVFHQLLQWHQMLSAKLPPDSVTAKSVNMFWDGVFHLLMLVDVGVGIVLLWWVGRRREADKSGWLLAGGMLAGWGIFNIVEGLIDHQLVGLHNVREAAASPETWNLGFLIVSVLMLAVGVSMMRHRGVKPAAYSTDSIH
ncbi:DUF2243 domain-containing protein [Parachryseolinea silvisoli]|uniref:DUF2243 domain-containing protein n=1 Tax=Parachryseolinea silvisoli TaxID=2873601 RepID=UPI002265E023|nr:DUF2243 domain-containing protein [Parachryseolinea silvisoli]